MAATMTTKQRDDVKLTAKMDDCMFKCVVFSSYTICLVATTLFCTNVRICWCISAQQTKERKRETKQVQKR